MEASRPRASVKLQTFWVRNPPRDRSGWTTAAKPWPEGLEGGRDSRPAVPWNQLRGGRWGAEAVRLSAVDSHPWFSCLFQPLILFLSYYFDVTFFLLWFFSLFSCSFCLHHCFCESLSLCQRYIQREYITYTNEAWLKHLVNWASFTCYLECFLWGRWPFLEIKFYSLLLSDGLCIHFGKVENR